MNIIKNAGRTINYIMTPKLVLSGERWLMEDGTPILIRLNQPGPSEQISPRVIRGSIYGLRRRMYRDLSVYWEEKNHLLQNWIHFFLFHLPATWLILQGVLANMHMVMN